MAASSISKKKSFNGCPDFPAIARELQRLHPSIFGPGSPGLSEGISRQTVRKTYERSGKDGAADGRGRPSAVPDALLVLIVAALTSVVSARTTIMSAPMLQPIVLGVMLASGYAHLVHDSRGKRGVFCCGLHFVRGIMKERGWKAVRPQGDSRKLPNGWEQLRWLMVLRLAYFVFIHDIPKALVVNADHTGTMFTQVTPPCTATRLQGHTPPSLPLVPAPLSHPLPPVAGEG